jgi:glycosyltransferase involved in cell wall biosynthesis
MSAPAITFVVPCYNEEDVLPETAKRLRALLDELTGKGLIGLGSRITFIDDGSKDRTWQLIRELHTQDSRCHGLKLSRNRGHQHALLAGLLTEPGDAVLSLDADLQDDITIIPQMLEQHQKGAEIVYAVRSKRDSDSWFKRTTARAYYRLLQLMGVEVIPDHSDFRLMGRAALDALKEYGEVNLYLRGLIPLLGFKTAKVEFVRQVRFAGVTKYPLHKMLKLAIDGITSFSAVPLQLITVGGLIISLIALLLGFWAIFVKVMGMDVEPGWASTIVSIYLLGGLQLMALGVIGNYLAKIYLETKARPRFIIEQRL